MYERENNGSCDGPVASWHRLPLPGGARGPAAAGGGAPLYTQVDDPLQLGNDAL